MLFAALPALAQDLPDAGLPDASVGETGAERASEEEDTAATPCLSDRDCDRGLMCKQTRCVWRPWREATVEGCSSTGGLSVLGLALVVLARRRLFSGR